MSCQNSESTVKHYNSEKVKGMVLVDCVSIQDTEEYKYAMYFYTTSVPGKSRKPQLCWPFFRNNARLGAEVPAGVIVPFPDGERERCQCPSHTSLQPLSCFLTADITKIRWLLVGDLVKAIRKGNSSRKTLL